MDQKHPSFFYSPWSCPNESYCLGLVEILVTGDLDNCRATSSFLLLRWCPLGVPWWKAWTCWARGVHGEAASPASFPLVERVNYGTCLGCSGGGGCFHSSDVMITSLFSSWFLGCASSHSSVWEQKTTALAVWPTDFFTACLRLLEKASWAAHPLPKLHYPLMRFHSLRQFLLLRTF